MTIGNALFGRIAIDNFGKIQSEISDLQSRISSGKNDPRPSTDPMRAAQLSAMREQTGAVDRFSDNAKLASDRLTHADLALDEVSSIGRQFLNIAQQASNDTTTPEGRAALKAQAVALRQALVAAANRTDTMGEPLFAGLSGKTPFVDGPQGVTYKGDGGRSVLRMTETAMLATSLSGGEVFQSIPTAGSAAGGAKGDMFKMVDDLISTLTSPLAEARPYRDVNESGVLTPLAGRDGKALGFTLTGPKGSARIEAEVAKGAPGPLAAAINAASAETGVTASLTADGKGVALLAPRASFRIGDLTSGGDPRAPVATLAQTDETGATKGQVLGLRDARLTADAMVGAFSDAANHLAAQRAEVGALGALADKNLDALAARKVRLQEAVAGLEDLDVAAALTRLQTLLLTEQASQQSFVKISGTSLFDYLR
ncbi:MAG: flagellar biosynthesis protein FlgL [Rhodobacteraceae bacterium PARR1]|nr:MAG: flagellar biosynthesis protein FlgL [Rhodobacteraceae bacterium PARR1]